MWCIIKQAETEVWLWPSVLKRQQMESRLNGITGSCRVCCVRLIPLRWHEWKRWVFKASCQDIMMLSKPCESTLESTCREAAFSGKPWDLWSMSDVLKSSGVITCLPCTGVNKVSGVNGFSVPLLTSLFYSLTEYLCSGTLHELIDRSVFPPRQRDSRTKESVQ